MIFLSNYKFGILLILILSLFISGPYIYKVAHFRGDRPYGHMRVAYYLSKCILVKCGDFAAFSSIFSCFQILLSWTIWVWCYVRWELETMVTRSQYLSKVSWNCSFITFFSHFLFLVLTFFSYPALLIYYTFLDFLLPIDFFVLSIPFLLLCFFSLFSKHQLFHFISSLHSNSQLDKNIKGQMIKDLFNMAAFRIPENLVTTTNARYCIVFM